MKKYIEYLKDTLQIIGLISITIVPGITSLALALTINLWFLLILAIYIPLIPIIIIIWEKFGEELL